MATYQIQGADGSQYQVEGPDDADPSSVISQVTASHQNETPTDDYPGREVALGGKSVAEGVVGALTLPSTILTYLNNTSNQNLNKILGTNYKTDYQSLSQGFSSALDAGGAPTAQGSGENLYASGLRGLSGGLTGLGMGGIAQTVPNAIRAGTAGASAGIASEGARQIGLPPWAQAGAGFAFGMLPSAAEGSFDALRNLARPLTSSGQREIAGNILNSQASDPESALINLRNSAPIVGGSYPTSGIASGDTGLLGLEKGVRGISPVPFGERLSQQNTAQQTALGNMAGTPKMLEQAIAERSKTAAPLYAAAAQDSAPIDDEMIALMQRPHMQTAIAKASSLAQNEGRTFGLSSNSPGMQMNLSGQDLQGIKLALDDMQGTGFTQGLGSHELRALGNTSDALKDWMQRNVPSQRGADLAFQEASGPINRMTTLQDLQKQASTSAIDPQSRLPFLSSAKFSNALDKVSDDPFSGIQGDTLGKLQRIQQDLQSQQSINGPLLKAPGSDTFQNLAISQNLTGSGRVGGLAIKPLTWLYKATGVDSGVKEQLTNAMLDPKLAASIMSQAPRSQPNFVYGDLGSFFGLAGLH